MISSRVLNSSAPNVRNGNNVSSSASVPLTRALVTDAGVTSSSSDDDFSLDSSLANSRVLSSKVGRSYGRNSSYYTYSAVSLSGEILVAEREEASSTFGRQYSGGYDLIRACELDSKFSSGEGQQKNPEKLNQQRQVFKFQKAKQKIVPSAASEGLSHQHPVRLPTFHASARGPWHAMVSYDACVRLCLHAWAKGCTEAPMFLENECALLRETFGLKQLLLQSEEEMLVKQSSQAPHEGVIPNGKKNIGKMMVQVQRVKTVSDAPKGGGSISSLKSPFEKLRVKFYKISTCISSRWWSRKKNHVRNSSTSYDVVKETYSCRLRLKSLNEDDAIIMQPGSGESHVFFPDSYGDDLIVVILESNGNEFGRVLVQLANVSEVSVSYLFPFVSTFQMLIMNNPIQAEKLRWWSVFREPEHQLVGKVQLYIDFSASFDDNSHLKCGPVAETVAYDIVLEAALKTQRFQQRNLLLDGSWKWLLEEFASYYGISDVYTKLRYLSYVMDVATPTSDCLHLVHDLLTPIIMKKGNGKTPLSHQENRILNEIKDQIKKILKLVFKNYKSLDESSFSGMSDVMSSATGVTPPALAPAVKLYMLLHEIMSPEDQTNLCHYFQVGAKNRSRRHIGETDEFVTNKNDPNFWDPSSVLAAYQKMTMVCKNVKNEIYSDVEIYNQDILPSFLDLPNLSASIYSTDLCNRLRTFLVACPPSGPSPAVAELVVATSDFQRDLSSWNIGHIQGGVDAKKLFHQYILIWIQDRRLSLLESCKLDKVKLCGVKTQHSTTPFVDEMYTKLNETIQDYKFIISRWPEYIFVLESAIADVEKAIVEALEKLYADVLSRLNENLAPKMLSFKYVQKLTKRSEVAYVVPDELGILLNTMKRMLDVLRPNIEPQFKAWSSCIPDGGNEAPGDRLSEVTVMLRAKFRSYLQAVVERLVQNSKLQKATKLKKILQDSKESVGESDIKSKMQNLKEQLIDTVNHLHSVCDTNVFIALTRGYWDCMGQIVLSFLENRKENRDWYKGSRVAVSILDDTFAAQMQQLLGKSLREQDVEPPRSIVEVRSILCKEDTTINKGKSF
ncbi:unnamed protein product [Eruca vesicaria subsp. sativa]|uniref:Pesticidal crystal cry8Ba protein n=1 Tax=Eruca vesicaria subsp. sativa TaxID=29727 RepID=A0ABC8L2Y2_ERUVS|nr:unnamed protein product [Eruca vesicaria subsp. sativa]